MWPHLDTCSHTTVTQRQGLVRAESLWLQGCVKDVTATIAFAAHQCPHRIHPEASPSPALTPPTPSARLPQDASVPEPLTNCLSSLLRCLRGCLPAGPWTGSKPRSCTLRECCYIDTLSSLHSLRSALRLQFQMYDPGSSWCMLARHCSSFRGNNYPLPSLVSQVLSP